MGVGKTAVGKILSEKTGLTYVDLDEEIVKKKKKTIPKIFEEEGEAGFRKVEKEVTREITRKHDQIIACGGGTVLDPENYSNLKKNSVMILLNAEPRVILQRTESEGDTRPLLMVEDKLERIKGLLRKRLHGYLEAADLIVDTSEMTPQQVASEILKYIRGLNHEDWNQ
jgi:shikimate kinase